MNVNEILNQIIANEHLRKLDVANRASMSQSQFSTLLKSDMRISTLIRILNVLGYSIVIRKNNDDTEYELKNK